MAGPQLAVSAAAYPRRVLDQNVDVGAGSMLLKFRGWEQKTVWYARAPGTSLVAPSRRRLGAKHAAKAHPTAARQRRGSRLGRIVRWQIKPGDGGEPMASLEASWSKHFDAPRKLPLVSLPTPTFLPSIILVHPILPANYLTYITSGLPSQNQRPEALPHSVSLAGFRAGLPAPLASLTSSHLSVHTPFRSRDTLHTI